MTTLSFDSGWGEGSALTSLFFHRALPPDLTGVRRRTEKQMSSKVGAKASQTGRAGSGEMELLVAHAVTHVTPL